MGIEADQLISGRGDAGADSPSEIGADDGLPRDKPGVGTGMLGWACRPRNGGVAGWGGMRLVNKRHAGLDAPHPFFPDVCLA
jgi:hypothetical protein